MLENSTESGGHPAAQKVDTKIVHQLSVYFVCGRFWGRQAAPKLRTAFWNQSCQPIWPVWLRLHLNLHSGKTPSACPWVSVFVRGFSICGPSVPDPDEKPPNNFFQAWKPGQNLDGTWGRPGKIFKADNSSGILKTHEKRPWSQVPGAQKCPHAILYYKTQPTNFFQARPERRTADGERRTADGGRRAADGGRRTAAADGGRRTAGIGKPPLYRSARVTMSRSTGTSTDTSTSTGISTSTSTSTSTSASTA